MRCHRRTRFQSKLSAELLRHVMSLAPDVSFQGGCRVPHSGPVKFPGSGAAERLNSVASAKSTELGVRLARIVLQLGTVAELAEGLEIASSAFEPPARCRPQHFSRSGVCSNDTVHAPLQVLALVFLLSTVFTTPAGAASGSLPAPRTALSGAEHATPWAWSQWKNRQEQHSAHRPRERGTIFVTFQEDEATLRMRRSTPTGDLCKRTSTPRGLEQCDVSNVGSCTPTFLPRCSCSARGPGCPPGREGHRPNDRPKNGKSGRRGRGGETRAPSQ